MTARMYDPEFRRVIPLPHITLWTGACLQSWVTQVNEISDTAHVPIL